MCCLFGYFNYSGQAIKDINTLTNSLAEQATVRGTDATGIAYNDRGRIVIHKEPKAAYFNKIKLVIFLWNRSELLPVKRLRSREKRLRSRSIIKDYVPKTAYPIWYCIYSKTERRTTIYE